MATSFMLTTKDNPYDPFEEFALWLLYDNEQDYNSCGKLARVAQITSDMSQVEIENERERAIDEIIKHDFLNIYQRAFPKGTVTQPIPSEES